MVLQSTLTGALRMHGTPRMHSGAAGGPVVGHMEIGTADGQISMSQVNRGGASGGPCVLQKVRAVLQSTLQQLHKVQNMLDRLQNKLLDSMRHLQNELPDKLQTVLQNTFHQRHELQNMVDRLRNTLLNSLHKLQTKLPNRLRAVLQSTLHQLHKLQNMLYQLHQHFWF